MQTIICQKPKINPHRQAIQQRIAELLDVAATQINIKATTTEELWFYWPQRRHCGDGRSAARCAASMSAGIQDNASAGHSSATAKQDHEAVAAASGDTSVSGQYKEKNLSISRSLRSLAFCQQLTKKVNTHWGFTFAKRN